MVYQFTLVLADREEMTADMADVQKAGFTVKRVEIEEDSPLLTGAN